jgi:hypothetical protein
MASQQDVICGFNISTLPDELTVEDFLKQACEREVQQLLEHVECRIEEFKEDAKQTRKELERLSSAPQRSL